mmetsp:Transcript_4138/g.6094  ORF Transcript_4138/g.6094 Transcript_4138/m.6094 type:complete len:212 (+) Transcript_4138:1149-1784(+)
MEQKLEHCTISMLLWYLVVHFIQLLLQLLERLLCGDGENTDSLDLAIDLQSHYRKLSRRYLVWMPPCYVVVVQLRLSQRIDSWCFNRIIFPKKLTTKLPWEKQKMTSHSTQRLFQSYSLNVPQVVLQVVRLRRRSPSRHQISLQYLEDPQHPQMLNRPWYYPDRLRQIEAGNRLRKLLPVQSLLLKQVLEHIDLIIYHRRVLEKSLNTREK